MIGEARDLWRLLNNEVMLADSFGSEAEAHFNAGQFDLALECCQQALQITEKIGNLWGQSYDRMLMSFVLFERGELGGGIQLAEQSIQLADQAGLIASGIGLRSELAWIYSYCGALERGLEVVDKAFQVAEMKQPAWKAFPQAAKIRMYLLQGDVPLAQETAGIHSLRRFQFHTRVIPSFFLWRISNWQYRRGRISPCAQALVETLYGEEVLPSDAHGYSRSVTLERNSIAGIETLRGSSRSSDQARSLAETPGCDLHLWTILTELADVNRRLETSRKLQQTAAEARANHPIDRRIAREIGLANSFLNQPRVQKLMRA